MVLLLLGYLFQQRREQQTANHYDLGRVKLLSADGSKKVFFCYFQMGGEWRVLCSKTFKRPQQLEL